MLETSHAELSELISGGDAARFVGMDKMEFFALFQAGKVPFFVEPNGEAMFTKRSLQRWVEYRAHEAYLKTPEGIAETLKRKVERQAKRAARRLGRGERMSDVDAYEKCLRDTAGRDAQRQARKAREAERSRQAFTRKEENTRRNIEILAYYRAGFSHNHLAHIYGLSRTSVHWIIVKEERIQAERIRAQKIMATVKRYADSLITTPGVRALPSQGFNEDWIDDGDAEHAYWQIQAEIMRP